MPPDLFRERAAAAGEVRAELCIALFQIHGEKFRPWSAMQEAVSAIHQGLENDVLYDRRAAALRQVQWLFHGENVACP